MTTIAIIVVLLLLAYIVLSKEGNKEVIETGVTPTNNSEVTNQNPPAEETEAEETDAVDTGRDNNKDTVKPATPSDAASMDESDGLE